MKKNKDFMLWRSYDLAQYIKNLCLLNTCKEDLPQCKFAVAKIDGHADDSLENILKRSEGWYGIRAIDVGFDSTDSLVVCDYYTGGCPQVMTIHEGQKGIDIIEGIDSLIKNVVKTQKSFSDKIELIVKLF